MTVISFFVKLINMSPIALCICLLDCAFSICTKNPPFLRHACFNPPEETVYMTATKSLPPCYSPHIEENKHSIIGVLL